MEWLWKILGFISLGLLVFALLICGFVAAQAATSIKEYGYDTDEDLKNAHALAAGTASIAFIVAILSVAGGIYLFAASEFTAEKSTYGLTAVLGISLVISGAMAAYAAGQVGEWLDDKSSEGDEALALVITAKRNLAWAASAAFISIGILVVAVIFKKVGSKSDEENKAVEVSTPAENVKTAGDKNVIVVAAPPTNTNSSANSNTN